ncbi:MAG: Nramp family divalent metal transporter [Fuerstiella sp.]|nr:Nramp family divalent metal transporter [Fuerstiella sp.]
MTSKYPELPPEVRDLSFRGMLLIFGPGAIIASVTIGSGETVFPSRSGAIFGYSLLWCFVLGTIIKGFQIYSGARFMTLSGRHPLESWSELPGPKNWFVWCMTVLSLFCMPLFLGGVLPRMLADFVVSDLVGVSADDQNFNLYACLWGTLFIVVAMALTFVQSYDFLEKAQTAVIGLLLLCIIMAVASSSPDLVAILKGMFIPTVPRFESWVTALPDFKDRDPWIEAIVAMGVLGGGTQDYFGYLGLLREKGWGLMSRIGSSRELTDWNVDSSDDNVTVGKKWLRAPLIDISMSFTAILFFTICFVVLGAVILNPQQRIPSGTNLLTEQAAFLVRDGQSSIVQSALGLLYKTGIFFAFFGTIHGAFELYTRTTQECLIVAAPKLRQVPLKKFRLVTVFTIGIVGLILLWCSLDPVKILTPAAVISATLTCGLWCFAIIWSDRSHLPQPLRMGRPLVICVFLSGIALTVFGINGISKWLQSL